MNKRYNLPVAIHVGELIREWLDENNMSNKEFALRTGKPEKTISNILNGKSGITKETAQAFEIVTGISADYFLRFQASYNDTTARLKNRYTPKRAIHPGEILNEELLSRGMQKKTVAKELGIPSSSLSEYLKGKRNFTPEFCVKLERVVGGISANDWMRLQNRYEEVS